MMQMRRGRRHWHLTAAALALADRRKHQNQYGNLPESERVAVPLKGIGLVRSVLETSLALAGVPRRYRRRYTGSSTPLQDRALFILANAVHHTARPCPTGRPVQGQRPVPAAWTECRFGLDQRTFTAARPQRASRERSYSPSVFSRCIFLRKRRRSVRHTGNPPIIGWKAHSNGVLRRSYLFRC
jgi:hypothetical protein